MDQLPNYRTHEQDSDNGQDAVELAQFYMLLDKEGTHCPHGINYDTGRTDDDDGKRERNITLALPNNTHRICPCCCKVQEGVTWSQGGYQRPVPENSTYCHTCRPK